MPRQDVSLEELFTILDQEFTAVRDPQCGLCITPLPMRRATADDVSTNWFVVEPQDCPHDCGTKLAEIVMRMMERVRARAHRLRHEAQRQGLASA